MPAWTRGGVREGELRAIVTVVPGWRHGTHRSRHVIAEIRVPAGGEILVRQGRR